MLAALQKQKQQQQQQQRRQQKLKQHHLALHKQHFLWQTAGTVHSQAPACDCLPAITDSRTGAPVNSSNDTLQLLNAWSTALTM
jgi:hypothetical protein